LSAGIQVQRRNPFFDAPGAAVRSGCDNDSLHGWFFRSCFRIDLKNMKVSLRTLYLLSLTLLTATFIEVQNGENRNFPSIPKLALV
jgi:hypothetical protein